MTKHDCWVVEYLGIVHIDPITGVLVQCPENDWHRLCEDIPSERSEEGYPKYKMLGPTSLEMAIATLARMCSSDELMRVRNLKTGETMLSVAFGIGAL